MKKILLTTCILFMVVQVVSGQDSTIIRAKQSVQLEIGGTGQGLSLSYDHIFNQKNWKFGARAGFGAISFTKVRPTILGEVYALAGKRGNYLELGLGASYLFPTTSQYTADSTLVTFRGADQVWLVSRIGYRKQSTKKGNVFRVALSPTFVAQSGRFTFRLYPSLCFGQSF